MRRLLNEVEGAWLIFDLAKNLGLGSVVLWHLILC